MFYRFSYKLLINHPSGLYVTHNTCSIKPSAKANTWTMQSLSGMDERSGPSRHLTPPWAAGQAFKAEHPRACKTATEKKRCQKLPAPHRSCLHFVRSVQQRDIARQPDLCLQSPGLWGIYPPPMLSRYVFLSINMWEVHHTYQVRFLKMDSREVATAPRPRRLDK